MTVTPGKASLSAYTVSHFCVDFACFYMLTGGFREHAGSLETAALGFLLYNTLAFGLQPVIGYVCDRTPRLPIALMGCGLLAAGLLLMAFPWPSLILCALGNACFHVGGGIDSLVHAGGRMARSGVFVSSGALGVALGTLAGNNPALPAALPLSLTALSALLILVFARKSDVLRPAPDFPVTRRTLSLGAALLLCLLSVMIRAYGGSVVPIGWKTTTLLMLLPGLAAFAGKAAGGFAADRLGTRTVGVVSLLLSIPLLSLGYADPLWCAAGIVLFNMSMPVTLCAVASRLPRYPGLAFGLTTLALLCGVVPTYFMALSPAWAPAVTALFTLVSLGCLITVLINQKGANRYEKSHPENEHEAV